MKSIQQVVSRKKIKSVYLADLAQATLSQQLKTPVLFLILFWSYILNANAQVPTDATLSVSSGTGQFFVALPDSNIVEIELQIGTKQGLSDVFSHTFTFDQTTGLPAGMTFTRNGLNSYLGLGAITTNTVYASKVRLKSTSGTWGDWYEIISN
jgi:hypothetical protein